MKSFGKRESWTNLEKVPNLFKGWLQYIKENEMKAKCLLIVIIALTIAGILVSSSYAIKIDPNSILGVWLFDGGKSDVAKDSSENSNDGAIKGNPGWVEGKFKKALEFDGASNFVDVPVNLNECKEVTEVVWTYTHKLPPGERYQIISNDGGSYGRCIMIRPANYWIFHTEGQAITYAVVPTLNSWEHLAATWTTKEVKFYINGKLVATGAGDSPVYNDTVTVNIGRCPFRNGDFYDGALDEVALFSVVLTEDEIKSIADDGLERTLGIAAVSCAVKLTTTWASIKAQ
jgi:hypothetical protein